MSCAPNPNGNNQAPTGDEWFQDLGFMDSSINNAYSEDNGLNVLENIRSEEFFSLGQNDLQQQEPQQQQEHQQRQEHQQQQEQQPRQSTSAGPFVSQQSSIHYIQSTQAQQNYEASLALVDSTVSTPSFSGVIGTTGTGVQNIQVNYLTPEQIHTLHTQSLSNSPNMNFTQLVTNSTSQIVMSEESAKNYGLYTQSMNPPQPGSSVTEIVTPKLPKPKKPRKPRAPKKLKESVPESIQPSVQGSNPIQSLRSIAPSAVETVTKIPPKPRGPRKKKSQSLPEVPTAEALSTAVNQAWPGGVETQQLQLQGPSFADKLLLPVSATTTKPKAPRKYYPRKPKPTSSEATVTPSAATPTTANTLVKPQKPRNPKKAQTVKPTHDASAHIPSGQNNTMEERLALYLGSSDPTLINSQLTLHYEQQSSMNLSMRKVAGQESTPLLYSGAELQGNFNQPFPVSSNSAELSRQLEVCNLNLTYSRPKPARQYGQASTTTNEPCMFDTVAAKIYEERYPNVSSGHFSTQQQIQPSTLVSPANVNKHVEPLKPPIPAPTTSSSINYVQPNFSGFTLLTGGFNSFDSQKMQDLSLSNAPPIKTAADLTLYESECLRKYRQSHNIPNIAEPSGISDGTESLSAEEVRVLTKYREGRNRPRAGHKSKKEEKLANTSLVLYSTKEPRRCTPVKPHTAFSAPASKSQSVEQREGQTQCLQSFSSAFHPNNNQIVNSTYEHSICSLRPTLPKVPIPTTPNTLVTIAQPSYHSYPIMTPSFPFQTTPSTSSTPAVSTSIAPQISYHPQNYSKTSSNSLDSVIQRVSCEGPDLQRSESQQGQRPVVSAASIGVLSKKPKNLSAEKTRITSKTDSKGKPVEISTIDTNKAHQQGPVRTPKTKNMKKDSFERALGAEGIDKPKKKDGRGRPIKSVQPNSDLPQDLSIHSSTRTLEIVASRGGSVESVRCKSLREFCESESEIQGRGPKTDLFTSIQTTVAQHVNTYPPSFGSHRVTASDNRVVKKPNISPGMSSTPQAKHLSDDDVRQLQRMKITSGSGDPNCQKVQSVQSSGFHGSFSTPIDYHSLASKGELSFETLSKLGKSDKKRSGDKKSKRKAKEESATMSTLGRIGKQEKHKWDNVSQQKRNSSSPGSSKSPQRGGSNAMDWVSNSFRTGEKASNQTETTKTGAPMSSPMSTAEQVMASILPKPLLKGTARIPKLTVAKNKNPAFICGQGRSSAQIQRVINASGLSVKNPNSEPSGLWPSLKQKVDQESSGGVQKLNRKQYAGKRPGSTLTMNRLGDPNVRNTQHNTKGIRIGAVGPASSNFNSGLLKSQSSNAKIGVFQQDRLSVFSQNKRQERNMKKELVELELQKGCRRTWTYSPEERNFLYSEGKYLIKRDDINKKREEVDIWRIEEGFQSLKRYRPQNDFSREFHVGEDTFVPIKRNTSFYVDYHPVYVTICIETDSLQVVQYFQADRFLPHLKFMYQHENLYEDYYHLLQILICQVMDPNVIEEAIIKEPGDKQWKHSWNATEEILTSISDRIAKMPRWNKSILNAIKDWPTMSMSTLKIDKTRVCEACVDSKRVSGKRITLTGVHYDRTRFSALAVKPEAPKQGIQFCHGCALSLRPWSRIVHAKYDIFRCTRQRILQLIKAAPSGTKFDPPNVRDYLMNDHNWIRRMFYDYLVVLADGYKIIEKSERPGSFRTENH